MAEVPKRPKEDAVGGEGEEERAARASPTPGQRAVGTVAGVPC